MTAPEGLPLVHEHRPGTAASDAPAVVLIHGRGTDERDLLPLGAQLPDELEKELGDSTHCVRYGLRNRTGNHDPRR